MSILERWDEDYNNNNGIPWSEFVKTVDKSNYSPDLFNDNGDNVDGDEDEDLYPEDDNLYSDEEIAAWEKERAGNKKSEKDVTFITVHPNGGEGHVIALDDEKKVVSPDAGEFKGTTLSSAKSVGLDELEKKSSEKPSKKVKSKSDDDDDEPAGVEKGTKEYYQAKVDKYEKRLKMYSMKMEELQKKIDSGDSSAAEELEKYKKRQARVEKKLAGYKKNLEKFSDSKPFEDVKKEEAPSLSKSKSEPTASAATDKVGEDFEEVSQKPDKTTSKSTKSDTVNGVSNVQDKLEAIESSMAMPGDEEWEEAASNNIESVNARIKPWGKLDTPANYQSAIEYYTKGDYRSFNWAVVGSSYSDVTSSKNITNARNLDKLFNDPASKTTGDTVLFRSMNSRHLPKGFFEGEPYVDSQVVSTSASHKLTHAWYKSNKCELAIYLPKGSTAVNVSKLGVQREAETILPPNTAYRYIGTVGYRKSITDKEPHPIYAVEAYTPKNTDISGTIRKNKKVFNEIRDSGWMPDEFHKGIYNLAEELVKNQVSFEYVSKQLGSGVSEENVWEYYNKYNHMFTGGNTTPKGVHANWEKQLEMSDAASAGTLDKSSSLSTSKSQKKSKALKVKSPSDLDKILQAPDLYGIDTLESAAKSLLGEAGGSKWLDTYKNWYTSSMSDKLGAKFLVLATEHLKYYTEKKDYDPWNIKGADIPSIKKTSAKKA